MANKKISELDVRASLTLADLLVVGDPSTGYAYKITVNDLKTVTGAGVISFNGRVGAVVPTEGDYSLTQLSDTIITSAVADQLLKYNGSNWVNWTPNYLTAESDTLDSVTDRGNTTTNGITVGTMDVTGVLTGGDTIKSTNGTVTTSMSYGASAGIIGTTSNHSLEIRTNNVYRIGVNTSGVVNVSNLAGTGSRMVVTDAAGNLSSQAIPSGTVTSVGLSTGTTGTDVNVTGSPVTSSGSITLNIPDASATARGLITTGVQTIAGAKTFSGIAYFNNVVYLPNNTFDGSAAAFGGNNTATYLFGSYTYAYYKNIFNTAWSAGVLSNNPTAYLTTNLFLQRAITAPSTGSYGLVATVVIKGTPITANTGSVTTAAALVVDGTTTGATNNYSIWAAGGNIRFDSLAGTGSRMVVASATGVLSTQAIPTGTVTSVGVTVGTAGTDIAVSGSPITSSGTITIDIPTASASNRGALSSADWTTFNGKQNTLTFGNLTESTSSVLTITGGTGAVVGSGTSIQVKQASSTVSGFLSSTDWNTFNNKQNALTNPITGTGTSGQVAFFDGSTSLTSESNLFWDATNNRLGIGTDSPQYTLHIENAGPNMLLKATGAADAALSILGFDANIGIGDATNGNRFYLWNDGPSTTSKFHIASVALGTWYNDVAQVISVTHDGKVGIRNVSPSSTFDVTGTGQFTSAAAAYALRVENVHDSSNGLLVRSSDNDTTLYLARFQSSVGATSTTWVDRFSIAKNGSIVIGDNIPAVNVKLWVKGEDQTASNYAMDVTDSLGQSIAWFRNDKAIRFYGALTATSATFSSTEAIRITNDNGYISFFNTANTTRRGYIQAQSNNITLNAESGFLDLLSSGGTGLRIAASTGAATFSSSVTAQGNGSTFGTSSATGRALIVQAGSSDQAIMLKNAAGGDGTIFATGTSTTMNYAFNTYSTANAFVINNNGSASVSGNLTANSPSGGNTGEGIIAGRSFKIDASGTGQTAKMYVVSTTLSNTYGSGLQIQFANTADDKAFGFNLNTSGDFELYQKSSSFYRRILSESSGAFYLATYNPNTNLWFKFSGGDTFNTLNNTSGTTMYLNYEGNGAIKAGTGGGTTLYAGSDYRIKNNINVVENILNKVLQLVPKTYNYKDIKDEKLYYGFIAQEMEQVFPELVRTANGISMCNDEEIVDQKSIESFSLVWASILTKAIQELNAKIESK